MLQHQAALQELQKRLAARLCSDRPGLTGVHALRSRMKRAQSTPHAMALAARQASIEPFGSLHGHNGYGALMEEQKLKNRCAAAGLLIATVIGQVDSASTRCMQPFKLGGSARCCTCA